MTGRQCLQAILNHETPPRLAWTTLVDDLTRSVMPEDVRALPVLDFYRHLGCDVLQFGNYGLPAELQVQSPARRVESETQVTRAVAPDGTLNVTIESEWGTLQPSFRNGHPTKHPLTTLQDVQLALKLWGATSYVEAEGTEESFHRADLAIGDRGMYIPTLDPSPVQQLIELDMGPLAFYSLLQDYPHEVRDLLDVMHQVRLQEWEIVARRSPARALIPVENTSTTLISPRLYRELSLPQLRDYADLCHAHGKLIIFHMCGLLKDLLPDICETGLDGINAATPPPHGDTPLEHVLDVCGEDFIILGGILNGSVFQAPDVTAAQMRAALEVLYTPRLRRAPLLLWLGADGLPTPLERFLWVRDWFAEHGQTA